MAHAATTAMATMTLSKCAAALPQRRALRAAAPAQLQTAALRTVTHRGARLVVSAAKGGDGMPNMPEGLPQGFDSEAFQVLGIPGIEITPETQMADGSILKGRLREDGVVLEDTEEEEDLPLEIAWDEEGLFGQSSNDDLIARNMQQRQARFEEEEAERKAEERAKLRKELEEFRASRTVPENDPRMLMEYLLTTEINELEFEMTRCRPQLTEEFFNYTEKEVEETAAGERLDQLKGMLKATREFVAFMDANVQALAAPADRLKALFAAEDKKQHILEMAGEGQIDDPFMALFFTNIDMAYSSGNEKVGDYMKVMYDECKKFHFKTE